MSDAIYRNQIVVTVPSARADELEDAVEAALGRTGILDGAGHDGEATELFVYGRALDPLLEALLTVDYPSGSRAEVTASNRDASEETTMQVQLTGARKGRRTKIRTRRLAGSAGDVVAFDLGDGDGYVAARLSHVSKWFVVAWFFPRIHPSVPDRREVGTLASEDALVALRCFRHDLDDDRWTVLGRFGRFDQAEWPLPEVERVFAPTGQHVAIRLSPKDLTQDDAWVIAESEWWQRSPEMIFDEQHLPGFLELAMTDLAAAVRRDWERAGR